LLAEGAGVAPRAEREPAVILAADVVGCSRLVGADEAGMLARVKAHRVECAEPLITEYRGCRVKLTGGGAVVEFERVVGAVECAAAIDREMAEREASVPEERRICHQIGINIGNTVHDNGQICGDRLKLVARLEAVTEPGNACIAPDVGAAEVNPSDPPSSRAKRVMPAQHALQAMLLEKRTIKEAIQQH
jgi:adenylate cyclase